MTFNPDADDPTPEEIANHQPAIYAALWNIKRGLHAIPKDQRTQGGPQYKFRGIDQVQEALSPLMEEHGVVIACADRQVTETREFTVLVARYRFTSLVDGSYVETVSSAYGGKNGDKGLSAAGSAAYKYSIFELFCVPTEDQRDLDQVAPQRAAPAPKTATSPAMVDALAALTEFGGHLSPEEKRAMMKHYYKVETRAALAALPVNDIVDGTDKLVAGSRKTS